MTLKWPWTQTVLRYSIMSYLYIASNHKSHFQSVSLYSQSFYRYRLLWASALNDLKMTLITKVVKHTQVFVLQVPLSHKFYWFWFKKESLGKVCNYLKAFWWRRYVFEIFAPIGSQITKENEKRRGFFAKIKKKWPGVWPGQATKSWKKST